MNGKFSHFTQLLSEKLKFYLSISFGVFLFILFFQPFPLDRFDFNDRLLFVAGFGAIVFLITWLVRFIFSKWINRRESNYDEYSVTSYLSGFIIFVLCSVAFVFYLRYVGSVNISFYIVFKASLICLFPPAALKINEIYIGLVQQNELLEAERESIQKRIEKYEKDSLNRSVEFISETGSENLSVPAKEVIFIQSADNYVEIAFLDGSNIRKKLIRNTLKNVEIHLKQYSGFIRIHRTCIVNLHYIEKLHQDLSSHSVSIKGYGERLPVSRQYLIRLKEALQ